MNGCTVYVSMRVGTRNEFPNISFWIISFNSFIASSNSVQMIFQSKQFQISSCSVHRFKLFPFFCFHRITKQNIIKMNSLEFVFSAIVIVLDFVKNAWRKYLHHLRYLTFPFRSVIDENEIAECDSIF